MPIDENFFFCHRGISFSGTLIEARLFGEGLRDLLHVYEEINGELVVKNRYANEIDFLKHLFIKLREYPDVWVLT
jgi:hypothetical protein